MNTRLVVDTSVLVKWLNTDHEDHIDQADQIMQEALKGTIQLLAPELAKYELGNVLLKGKQLTPTEAFITLGTAYSLPITFITESEDLAKKTFELASKCNITYYDASFLSLAEKYGASLLSENIKHQGKYKKIEIVSLKEI